VFAGARENLPDGPLRVLAHYQCLAPWRQAPDARKGAPAPRVFIGDTEIADPFEAFSHCQLTPEPAIEISGASGVTLMLAFAANKVWHGHVPGPNGLPGGYPVKLEGGTLRLDLPSSVTEKEAIDWNEAFEARKGLTVKDGHVHYHGRLKQLLVEEGADCANGFALKDLEAVCAHLLDLRERLSATPSKQAVGAK
jgi:hypothetical protein